jgi:hypothetical protein
LQLVGFVVLYFGTLEYSKGDDTEVAQLSEAGVELERTISSGLHNSQVAFRRTVKTVLALRRLQQQHRLPMRLGIQRASTI